MNERYDAGVNGDQDNEAAFEELTDDIRKRRRRNPVLNLVVLAITLFIIYHFKSEFTYWFSSSEPIDLGVTDELLLHSKQLPHNRLVKVKGLPDPRVAEGEVSGKPYKYFNLIGSWIFVRQPKEEGGEKGRYGHGVYVGRLLQIERDARYAPLKDFFKQRLNMDIPDNSYILLTDDLPHSGWLIPAILSVLAVIIIYNIINLIRGVIEFYKLGKPTGRE